MIQINIEVHLLKKIEIEKLKEKNQLSVGTSVETGEGIEKGFDWMVSILNKLCD